MNANFFELKGQIIESISVIKNYFTHSFQQRYDEIIIRTKNNCYRMYHEQTCSESVTIQSINGDLNIILGREIILAEEDSVHEKYDDYSSKTITKFIIKTEKSSFEINWVGTSNGFYSESVKFECVL